MRAWGAREGRQRTTGGSRGTGGSDDGMRRRRCARTGACSAGACALTPSFRPQQCCMRRARARIRTGATRVCGQLTGPRTQMRSRVPSNMCASNPTRGACLCERDSQCSCRPRATASEPASQLAAPHTCRSTPLGALTWAVAEPMQHCRRGALRGRANQTFTSAVASAVASAVVAQRRPYRDWPCHDDGDECARPCRRRCGGRCSRRISSEALPR